MRWRGPAAWLLTHLQPAAPALRSQESGSVVSLTVMSRVLTCASCGLCGPSRHTVTSDPSTFVLRDDGISYYEKVTKLPINNRATATDGTPMHRSTARPTCSLTSVFGFGLSLRGLYLKNLLYYAAGHRYKDVYR